MWTRSFNHVASALMTALATVAGVGLITAVPANGSFAGYYDLANFTLVNVNADGFVETPDAGLTAILTGGNNGTGLPGTTDLRINADQTGSVRFTYLYQTMDVDPSFDVAGYVLANDFFPLSDTQESGSVVFPVTTGQSFGFRIATTDNQGNPASLTISDFSVGSEVPEPGFALPVGVLLAALAGWRFRNRLFPASRRKRVVAAVLSAVCVCAVSASAQSQMYYTGTNATGRLVRTAETNVRQAGSTFQALSRVSLAKPAASSKKPALPEFKTNEVRPQPGPRIRAFALAAPVLTAPGLTVTTVTTASSFLGLTHYDQRNANNGNQFSIEPPSEEIAVANGFILEGVNNAIQVYSTSGTPLLPAVISTNQLFAVPAAIDRNTGINGVYPTDMRVFYEQGIQRWFVVQRAQDYDTAGNPLASSHLYVAVSQTNDPTGTYTIYTMDTTNASRVGCPCFSDFPQIGADQYGVYISSDEYDTSFGRFADVSILAISKSDLANGSATPTMQEIVIPRVTGFEGTVRPAITPPGANSFLASGGVEFFLSTNAAAAADNRFGLWALTNTASLNTTPNLTLIETIIPGFQYLYPDVATQKPGTLEYGSQLSPPGQLAFIDGGRDSRVLSLTYSGGRLYVALQTKATDATGHYVVAGAYGILAPTLRLGVLAAPLMRSGYLLVNGNHVLRPAIAVNPQGKGAIVFTLVGPDYYPSAAFVPMSLYSTSTTAQVAGIGVLPEDGFTGYPDLGYVTTGVARWGDYSCAVAVADGSIWMAAEYIPDAPRTDYANWGTRVAHYVQ